MAKRKGSRRPPKASSPAVSYAAERAMARSEGRDPEAVPMPDALGRPPSGMSSPALEVIERARAEGAAAERARIEGEKKARPAVRYSNALADRIIERLEAGESVTAICQSPDMPVPSTVIRWGHDPDHPFSQRYAQARARGYRIHAEEIMDIADEVTPDAAAVARNRLRIDTRKWILSKMLPKEYGDKLELFGDPDKPLYTEVRRTIVDPNPSPRQEG